MTFNSMGETKVIINYVHSHSSLGGSYSNDAGSPSYPYSKSKYALRITVPRSSAGLPL